MIFDSEQAHRLVKRYEREPDYCVPQAVFMARSDALKGECQLVEQIVASAPKRKHKDWKSRLLSKDDPQHLGAWFEVRLYEWLQEHGSVEVEPQVVPQESPDFLLTSDHVHIFVEARAATRSQHERDRWCVEATVRAILESIERPFSIHVSLRHIATRIDKSRLQGTVLQWLDETPETEFTYADEAGNRFRFEVVGKAPSARLRLTSTRGEWVKPGALHQPIHEKAKQHRVTRNSGSPYVIALLLESSTQSSEEVVETWFGRETHVFDFDTGEFVEMTLDDSGLYFKGGGIQHQTVSGTLVFRRVHLIKENRYALEASYVENPWALNRLAPHLFQVKARYVARQRGEGSFVMVWESSPNMG